jgi:hypothetical protein
MPSPIRAVMAVFYAVAIVSVGAIVMAVAIVLFVK